MSDDFDKEAERRRLREKYEKDQEGRETTERMSELLLQGATMTNRHCDTCGSPIFRYQGQAFCPQCQMDAEAGGAVEGADQTAGGDAQPADTQPPSGDVQQATGEGGLTSEGQHTGERQPPGEGEQTAGDEGRTSGEHPASREPPQSASSPRTQGSEPPVDADALAEIEASLTRTLARFAQRAAETEDPHRAREYLETAKRAAETLRALPR